MKCKRILSAVLAVLLLMCFLPQIPVQAQENKDFSGNRTVEYIFDSSDLDNYANGGRAGVDLYLRKSAPRWLSYSLHGDGRNVVLTYSIDFNSFADYSQKIGVLLTSQPNILYNPGEDLVLVENFDAVQLLSSLQLALEQSQELLQWAKVTKDTLTICGESYDFTGARVNIGPEVQSEILFQTLYVDTLQKKEELTRTISITISTSYTERGQWQALVRRCKKVGQVTQEKNGDILNFEVTFKASSLQILAEKTGTCLDIPVSLSVDFTEVTEESCTYLLTENFFLNGYMKEDGRFSYSYACPKDMENITAISENTSYLHDDGVGVKRIEANNQFSIKFSYTAPFRFEQIHIHTDWSSSLNKIRRTITLTTPIQGAQVYHETIKSGLSDAMPKGTVLEIYDQEQTRYYVLTFSSWFWSDVEKFTAAFMDVQIEHEDSWMPMGQSSYTETLDIAGVLNDFDPVFSIQVSYCFPGDNTKAKLGTMGNGILTFTDINKPLQIEYCHLNFIKLAVLVMVVAAVLIIVIKVIKALKARRAKVQTPKPEPVTPLEPLPAKKFCNQCGKPMNPDSAFCPNCGARHG